jgi:hypothetical protein
MFTGLLALVASAIKIVIKDRAAVVETYEAWSMELTQYDLRLSHGQISSVH